MEDAAAAVIGQGHWSRVRMKKFRSNLPFLAATLGCAVAWLSPSAVSATTNLDPFARPTAKPLLPFHTAQAEEAPAGYEEMTGAYFRSLSESAATSTPPPSK